MSADDSSHDSGWKVVGSAGASGSSRGAPSAQRSAAAGSSQNPQWPHISSSRSGHATPWSGYATPQSGYASPRSGYASPRITPQRGRPPPSLALSSARAGGNASTSVSGSTRARSQRELQSAANISRASTPGLKQPSSHIPTDVVIEILQHYARISPSCALNALLVSKSMSSAVEEAVYGTVSLFTVTAMASFHELVKSKPDVGRKVKGLWIAPGTLKSDLIPCLAPPTSNASNDARQRKVQSLARDILRSCRRLNHLAMDGGFLTPQSATAFGTACKPKTLLCVNPHSFLGHFSAPIFRQTVRRLEIVDTTLAVEEVDEIRQMQGLHAFVWTSPRAKSDVTRDVSVLLRILSPRAADIAALQEADGTEDAGLAEILAASGSALPDRSRQNDKLQSICTATSHARAAALAASFKKVVESVTIRDDDVGTSDSHNDEDIDDITRAMRAIRAGGGVYVDSSISQSSALHAPSGVELQTEALSSLMHALAVAQKAPMAKQNGRGSGHGSTAMVGRTTSEAYDDSEDENSDDYDDTDDDDDDDDDDEVVEEWEALRDVVCQRRTANSTTSSRFFAGVGSGSVSGHGMSGSGLLVRSTGSSSVRSAVTSGAQSTTASGISTPAAGWASQAVSRVASRAASPSLGTGSDEIDGGRALQRIWRRWRTQVATGALERFVC